MSTSWVLRTVLGTLDMNYMQELYEVGSFTTLFYVVTDQIIIKSLKPILNMSPIGGNFDKGGKCVS